MTQNDLEPVVTRLTREFDDVLPTSMVEACVALAAPPGTSPSELSAVESAARADLVELAAAATRGAVQVASA